MFELKGKVALVTGGASGIGLGCVKELLKNGLKGVAVVDVNKENGQRAVAELRKEFGPNSAIFVKADVSDKKEFEEAFEETVQTYKQLDILFNNAGIINELQWEKCATINFMGTVIGTMLATEKYFPKYKSGPEAVIVNNGSTAALQPFEPLPVYTATKFGVVGFTRALGSEIHYKRTGVRVLSVCPHTTTTPIFNMTTKEIAEPYLSMFIEACKGGADGAQTPEELAKNFVEMIKDAPTGSVWLLIARRPVKIDFPNLL